MEINWYGRKRDLASVQNQNQRGRLKLISSIEEWKKVRNKITAPDASIKMADGR